MGLGLHGGGVASALFFVKQGSQVTVTDLREKYILEPSLQRLKGFPIRFVLGKHIASDFNKADIIIKNPAVPLSSPFLKVARENGVSIETDISIFLRICSNPIIAVTGSKGKSTTASAVNFGLKSLFKNTKLGGNITLSPLDFVSKLDSNTPVVLELSSWQLADLKDKKLLRPKISIITNIFPDHLNRYKNMQEYVADKKIIYQQQKSNDYALFNLDSDYSVDFVQETKAHCLFFSCQKLPSGLDGAWLEADKGFLRFKEKIEQILDDKIIISGTHNRLNLLIAGMCLYLFGLKAQNIKLSLSKFPGIEHRLEYLEQIKGVKFYNDSAATIPQALIQAVRSIESPLILICGGTDKNIDFSPLANIAHKPKRIYLLEGSATEKIKKIFKMNKIKFKGPYNNLKEAVYCAYKASCPGNTILFSPGCASFGMFLNEFDRGRKFKKIVASLLKVTKNL